MRSILLKNTSHKIIHYIVFILLGEEKLISKFEHLLPIIGCNAVQIITTIISQILSHSTQVVVVGPLHIGHNTIPNSINTLRFITLSSIWVLWFVIIK